MISIIKSKNKTKTSILYAPVLTRIQLPPLFPFPFLATREKVLKKTKKRELKSKEKNKIYHLYGRLSLKGISLNSLFSPDNFTEGLKSSTSRRKLITGTPYFNHILFIHQFWSVKAAFAVLENGAPEKENIVSSIFPSPLSNITGRNSAT